MWGGHRLPCNMKGESGLLQSTFSLNCSGSKRHLDASYGEKILDRHRDLLPVKLRSRCGALVLAITKKKVFGFHILSWVLNDTHLESLILLFSLFKGYNTKFSLFGIGQTSYLTLQKYFRLYFISKLFLNAKIQILLWVFILLFFTIEGGEMVKVSGIDGKYLHFILCVRATLL